MKWKYIILSKKEPSSLSATLKIEAKGEQNDSFIILY